MNKNILIAITGIALAVGTGLTGFNKVYADEETRNLSPMARRIAERFGLSETEVESFVHEQRESFREEGRGKMSERLEQAVNEGALTEDQRRTLLAKMDEICDGSGGRNGELRDWAEENGVDLREINRNYNEFGVGNEGTGKRQRNFE